ncbi:MAG: glycerophosphodiester phosphodiesterase family protein [Anaerolineae bacterium]|nr:glycerophosphodiester phosphodiesterase family protein [Anaerolineae bacterium]
MKRDPDQERIDLRDADCIRARRPLLVAHRGGVIAANAPENSLGAIQLAAIHGYDMVELDVREARDGEPVLFHGSAGRGLWSDTGVPRFVEELTSQDLVALCYRGSTEHIATLAQALSLCASLGLGVMLDIKAGTLSERYLGRIADLLRQHDCGSSTVTIAHDDAIRAALADQVIMPVSVEDQARVCAGEAVPLHGQFWFGWAAELPNATLSALQRNGAFIIVSINTFHYPAHAQHSLARQDIRRLLAAGADGFQIDSVYGEAFGAM